MLKTVSAHVGSEQFNAPFTNTIFNDRLNGLIMINLELLDGSQQWLRTVGLTLGTAIQPIVHNWLLWSITVYKSSLFVYKSKEYALNSFMLPQNEIVSSPNRSAAHPTYWHSRLVKAETILQCLAEAVIN